MVPSKKVTTSLKPSSQRASGPGSQGHERRSSLDRGVRLQLPDGKPDFEELRLVTREWLVPRLVENFLQLHGCELKHSRSRLVIAKVTQLSSREKRDQQ
jgi:hypothetical protein